MSAHGNGGVKLDDKDASLVIVRCLCGWSSTRQRLSKATDHLREHVVAAGREDRKHSGSAG